MLSHLVISALLAAASVQGTVRAEGTREPVAHATVRIVELNRATRADERGAFVLGDVPAGRWRLEATALGHRPYRVTVQVPASGVVRLDLELSPAPVALSTVRVTGRTPATAGGAAAERELFDREAQPGVIGISQREMRALPATAEPDVLRALQSLPGVAALNDLNAQLHVRGGGPDQNLFLLDGARVFAPYHLFGLTGVFNTDAIARVEFFRGAVPARYGGALSSVVDLMQRGGGDERGGVELGASTLTGRAAAHGPLGRGGSWMVAARSSEATVQGFRFLTANHPYDFMDGHARVSLAPAPGQRLSVSLFASDDRFALGEESARLDLASRWRNGAASLRWEREGTISTAATAWASGYGGDLSVGVLVGDREQTAPVDNRVAAGGIRLEASRAAGRGTDRAGVELEGGRLSLVGSDLQGGYFQGEFRESYWLPAAYAEVERWIGRLRLAPGLRVAMDGRTGSILPEPRVATRLHLTPDVALAVGAGRSHQVLSTLRDDRQVLPGTVFWYVHPDGAPASRTDGVSAALEGWVARTWSFAAGAYARRFTDVPRWTPEGARGLEQLGWDDGTATGAELSVRRHEGRVTGWVGYGTGRVRMRDAQRARDYDAVWDRRHSLDAALFVRPLRALTLSAQATYGSGMPFWPWAGSAATPRMEPLLGKTRDFGLVPVFGDEQMRYPDYFRLDVGARYRLRLLGAELEPSLSLRNVTERPNVFYYRGEPPGSASDPALWQPVTLVPVQAFPRAMVVSAGLDARF
ncbi:MAG TPA: TonB-dependent receptor [Longimicrobium sp.]|nr:TonB-dependent receptor [Longimicrobium sp.]